MNQSSFRILSITLTLALVSLNTTSRAKLAAWYPLDEAPAAPAQVGENIESDDASMIGYDPDPNFSFVQRGHPAARANLGTSYLLTKGGGLDLGSSAAVQPTDQFTISFWCQPGTLDAFDRFFESQLTNTNAQDGMRLDMGGAGNQVRVLIRDNNGATNSQFSHPQTIKNDGTWYFVAFRYDSAGVENAPFQLTVIEADGTPVDGAAVTAATAGPAGITTGAIHFPHARSTLAGLEVPDNIDHPNNLHAALDELAFYDNSDGNGVLSDQQLADVYNFGPSGIQLISAFSSDVQSVAPGNPATLSWEVAEPYDSLILDDGLGNTTDLAPLTDAGSGSLAVSPDVTTTYSIRATRGTAANVSTLRILSGAAPAISSFASSESLIQVGSPVDLTWAVVGADSVTLDPGAVDVTGVSTIELTPTETTTYTLSATNTFGTSAAEVTVTVIGGPVPDHRYIASTDGNLDNTWADEVDTRDWNLTGALLSSPLATPSPNTNLGAAYSTGGGINGGATGSFQASAGGSQFSAEIWLRPGALNADHQVIFETGGGQNGVSALITEDGFRFLGSAANARTLDLTVPIDGLNVDDFMQLVFTTDGESDAFEVSVRDTFGTVRTASSVADVIIGNNGAGLFIHASGALGGDNNLGGRTELADMTPAGLTGFAGEIGALNIYQRVLEASDIQAAFDSIATTVDPPAEIPFIITKVEGPSANTLTLTWNSERDHLYDAEFSTSLQSWFLLDDTVTATGEQTTKTFSIPPNQSEFYLRIIDLGLD